MAEITINLRADPSQFEAGTKAAEKAVEEWETSAGDSADEVARRLEEVIRTLVKLGTQSGKSRADIVDDLRRFGLSAEQAEDAIEAVWDEMGEGQRAARDVEKAAESFSEVEKSADDAADATKRVGDESNNTGGQLSELGEIAKSVLEGDFGGAAESAIGALGALGLFAGAGGGLAALIGAGVGEIAADWLGQWSRAAEATNERIADMYADMLESGRAFLSDEFVTQRIAEIYDPKNVDEFNSALKLSNQLGIDRSIVIRAMSGDQDAHATVLERSRDRLAALNAEQEEYIAANGRESAALADKIGEVEIGIDSYNRYAGATETAAGRAREATDAINDTGASADTTKGKIDGVSLALESMPAGKTVVVDADTSAFFAAMEEIRRTKYSTSVGIDIVLNERRGTQVQ